MNRRQFLNISAATLASACLPACVDKDSSSPINQAIHDLTKNTTKLSVLYPKGSYGNISVIINAFEKQFGTSFVLQEASIDGIASEMMLNQQLNQYQHDIALPPTFNIPNLAAAAVIADLTDYAKVYEPADYFKSSLYNIGDRFLGRLYGYQADGDAYLIFYNQQFLNDRNHQKRYEDQFQQSLSTPNSWTELDQQIRFFHQPDQDCYGGSLFRTKKYMAWEFWARLHARGIYPVNDDMTPLIDSDIAIDELDKMIQLNNYLAPEVYKDDLFENFASFAEGNKYCNFGWGGTQKYLLNTQSRLNGQLSFSPMLSYDKNPNFNYMPSFNWGWNYVVSSQSKQKELAYLFCLFASSSQLSTLSVKQADGYFDPHREEHYLDRDIIDVYGTDFLQAHATSLQNSIPDFYLQGQSLYMNALHAGIYNASQGIINPAQSLQLVANKWQEITDKIGREGQIAQWRALKTTYPAHFKQLATNTYG